MRSRPFGRWILASFALLVCLSVSATAQDDRIARLISILEKKGISFTAEELAELSATVQPPPATGGTTATPQTDAEFDRAVEAALERRMTDQPKIVVPGVEKLRIRLHNRVRYEYYNNIYSPSDPRGRDDLDLVRMRNRLRFDFDLVDDIVAIFELQDVRIWGSEGSTVADTAGMDLKRGEVILKNLFEQPIDLEVGRFVLVYGDQRLIGGLEWFDQGRTYDGVRVKYHPEGYFIDVFATRIRETVTTNDDQDLFGVYGGTRNNGAAFNIEWYAIGFRDHLKMMGEKRMGNTLFATLGGRVFGKSDAIDYGAEVAYQTGDVRDDELSAYAASARIGFTGAGSLKPRVGLEVNYASGNETSTDGETEQFQVLFPTNHLHYGYADLAAWSNMINVRVSGSIQPHEKVGVTLDYHHLRLVDPDGGWINAGGGLIRGGMSSTDRHVGDELDLTIKWRPRARLVVLAGWSHFFDGQFVRETGGGGDLDFLYLQSFLSF